jgi:hypothetical protein
MSAIAEIIPANPGCFNSIRARIAAEKAHEARRMNKLAQSQTAAAIQAQPLILDDYQLRRLTRVRQQLDMLDAAIRAELAKPEPDGQRLNWLCAAQERLSEQERELAGRPKTGSLRPTVTKQRVQVPDLPKDLDE